MKNFNLNIFRGALALAFLLISASTQVAAQSTIFWMPSNDIIKEHNVSVKVTGTFKPNDDDAKKRFSSFAPRVTVGLAKNLEVGLYLSGNVQPGKDTTTIIPGFKWQMYHNEKHGVSVVTGNSFYVPLRNKKYDFGTYTFVQASKTFKSTKTRLTAGTYLYSKNVVAAKANRGGGQFALEQPINKKATFVTEWVTGKHYAGYVVPGMKIKFNKHLAGTFGYPISNYKAAQGNHFFLASLTYNFKY